MNSSIAPLLADIEKEIKSQAYGSKPKSLYEPIRYIMKLGGKRLRPMLTLLSYSLFKSDYRTIVPYACAVEAFHNFTLMHDDIMDKAPLRRGKATVHEKWNVNTAILAGDVMLVKVYDMLRTLDPVILPEALRLFNQCAAEVCEGQQWDIEFESKANVTEAQYLEMIRLKTAVLLGFSLEFGALLAHADAKDRLALRNFGTNIGVGFQLKDDVLDVYADKNQFGKQVGGDILANKKTFLLIKARQRARGGDKDELLYWLEARKFNPKKKVAAVTAIYDKLGVRQIAEAKAAQFFESGYAALRSVSAPNSTLALQRFAEELAARQK